MHAFRSTTPGPWRGLCGRGKPLAVVVRPFASRLRWRHSVFSIASGASQTHYTAQEPATQPDRRESALIGGIWSRGCRFRPRGPAADGRLTLAVKKCRSMHAGRLCRIGDALIRVPSRGRRRSARRVICAVRGGAMCAAATAETMLGGSCRGRFPASFRFPQPERIQDSVG